MTQVTLVLHLSRDVHCLRRDTHPIGHLCLCWEAYCPNRGRAGVAIRRDPVVDLQAHHGTHLEDLGRVEQVGEHAEDV